MGLRESARSRDMELALGRGCPEQGGWGRRKSDHSESEAPGGCVAGPRAPWARGGAEGSPCPVPGSRTSGGEGWRRPGPARELSASPAAAPQPGRPHARPVAPAAPLRPAPLRNRRRPRALKALLMSGARAAVSRPRRAAGASSDVASVCPPSRAGCDMHALDSWVNFCFRRGKGALRSPPPAPRAPLSSCEAGLSGRSRRCPRPAAPLHADQGPLTAAFVARRRCTPPPAGPASRSLPLGQVSAADVTAGVPSSGPSLSPCPGLGSGVGPQTSRGKPEWRVRGRNAPDALRVTLNPTRRWMSHPRAPLLRMHPVRSSHAAS